MNAAQVRAKARTAMEKRAEEVEQAELEGGELNLVPYLDIVTNILLFLLASVSAGILFGHINTALPDHAAAASVGDNQPTKKPDEQPLQLVVSVTKTDIMLWSISGLEGTLGAPKMQVKRSVEPTGGPEMLKLTDALYEIVNRRWPVPAIGKRRANADWVKSWGRDPSTYQLILQADPAARYETVIAVMDAARAKVTPPDPENEIPEDAIPLFPDVHFAGGFE